MVIVAMPFCLVRVLLNYIREFATAGHSYDIKCICSIWVRQFYIKATWKCVFLPLKMINTSRKRTCYRIFFCRLRNNAVFLFNEFYYAWIEQYSGLDITCFHHNGGEMNKLGLKLFVWKLHVRRAHTKILNSGYISW